MKRLVNTDILSVYRHITQHTAEMIGSFMADARRRTGDDAAPYRERAYGLYLGWRAMATEMTDSHTFRLDDSLLEGLISNPPLSIAELAQRKLY